MAGVKIGVADFTGVGGRNADHGMPAAPAPLGAIFTGIGGTGGSTLTSGGVTDRGRGLVAGSARGAVRGSGGRGLPAAGGCVVGGVTTGVASGVTSGFASGVTRGPPGVADDAPLVAGLAGVRPAPVNGSPGARTAGRLPRARGGGGEWRTAGAFACGSCIAASSASGSARVGSPPAAEPAHGSIGAVISSGTSWSSTSCTARGGSIAATVSRAPVHGSPTTAPLHEHPSRGARSITRRSFSEIRNATSARKSRAVGSIRVYPRFSAYNQFGAGAPPGNE